jgi:hypothetical protein
MDIGNALGWAVLFRLSCQTRGMYISRHIQACALIQATFRIQHTSVHHLWVLNSQIQAAKPLLLRKLVMTFINETNFSN